MVRKKTGRNLKGAEEKMMKRKNSRKKKIVIVCASVAVIALVAGVWFFRFRPKKARAMTPEQAMSTETTRGTISTTVVGTGTLQNDDAEAVKIPEGLTIDEVLVESGDAVKEGDVLATVNDASVLKELSAAQKELTALDEEINDVKDDEESGEVKTYIAGRVKKIYAQEGESVAAVMKDEGALLVLSIDDKMAVSLEGASDMDAGDSMTVTLSDGTEKEGNVESVSDGACVVTLTDDGTEIGDTVKVTDESGKEVGSGKLYVHQPIEITGTMGTVADIRVEENEEVSASETLMELENVPASAEYQQLLAERSSLAERLKMLTQLAADHTIRAEYDGIIESVEVTAEGSGDGGTGSGGTTANAVKGMDISTGNSGTAESSLKGIFTYASTAETEKKVTSITDVQAVVTGLSASVALPTTGQMPVSGIAETEQYTGKITWLPVGVEFAEKTVYTAVIELTAKAGYQFVLADGAELSYPGAQAVQWEIQEQCEQNTLKLTVVFPETAAKETEQPQESEKQTEPETTGGQSAAPDTQESQTTGQTPGTQESQSVPQTTTQADDRQQAGNKLPDASGEQKGSGNTEKSPSGSQNGTNGSGMAQSGGSGKTGVASGGSSGVNLSGASASSSSQSADGEDTTDTGFQTAFTVSGNESMLLLVNIDELDILSVQEQQKVTVTLDALEGETFEGEISKIHRTANNNGGVTKYTAEVTIPKDESMLAGMNATATISIERKENVLTLPAEAVQERGNRSFVYTEEGEDGTLSGEVEVETGISDGTRVEITSGLEEGQTVYYHVTGSEDSGEEGFNRMMMGGMMNGDGARPNGGGKAGFGNGTSGGNGGFGGGHGRQRGE